MLSNLFSSLGGKLGTQLGGGIFSVIGRYAGKMVGNYLEQKWFHKIEHSYSYDNIQDSFAISCAQYGSPIPLIFGQMRVSGKIIWADTIKIVKIDSESKKYFKNSSNLKYVHHHTELEYYLSFAVAICEGKISEISRIWINDEVIDLSKYKFRLYHGTDDQEPDPLINNKMNGESPAFRDLAYIVFEDLPLADFSHLVPNFSFEVTRKANIEEYTSLESMVRSMVIIPGSGEYVYDTLVQSKTMKDPLGFTSSVETINSHNIHKIADSVHSLNQLIPIHYQFSKIESSPNQ